MACPAPWGQVRIGWALAGVCLIVQLAHLQGARTSNDSYQYLSVAENLVLGNGAATSIVYFDEQYYSGTIPAPQSVFPPGYAVLVAVFYALGVPLEAAAVLVSAAAFFALVPLVLWVGSLLHAHPLAVGSALVVIVGNSASWYYATAAATEAVFTAATLLALALLLKAEGLGSGTVKSTYLLAGCVAAGLTYWVRYAGCFLVAAVLAFYFIRLLRRRSRQAAQEALLACAVLPPLVLACLWNLFASGTLRGGNTKVVSNPFGPLLQTFATSVFHLLVGDRTTKEDFAAPGWFEAAFLLVLTVLAVLFIRHASTRPAAIRDNLRRASVALVIGYVVVYIGGMFYLGKFSVISFGGRMFYPLCPVLALLAAGLFPSGLSGPEARPRRALSVVLVMAGLLYLGLHLRSALRVEPDTARPHETFRALLTEAGADGLPLAMWIESHVPEDSVVIAADGQVVGYVLHRRTLALASLEYSAGPWTEARLRDVATSYGADYLVLPLQSRDLAVLARESPFLREVAAGSLPPWLVPAARNQHVIIYRIEGTRQDNV